MRDFDQTAIDAGWVVMTIRRSMATILSAARAAAKAVEEREIPAEAEGER